MSAYWEGHLETALLSEKKNWVIRQLAVLPPWTLTGKLIPDMGSSCPPDSIKDGMKPKTKIST